MTNMWHAKIDDIRYPGGWSREGEVNLHMVMFEAGKWNGRRVEVVVRADQLERVINILRAALFARDEARAKRLREAAELRRDAP